MGDILQFPKIHRQFEVKATWREIHRLVYILHLHKNIGKSKGISDLKYWQKKYRKELKEYSYSALSDAFDRCILDVSMDYFPHVCEFMLYIECRSATSGKI